MEHGDALPRREGFAGVIVTGSAAMVTDRHDWSERSADWLRDAAHGGLPLLGICYGHQLIAHALGGEVGDNPAGREMGTVRSTCIRRPPTTRCSPACRRASRRRPPTCRACCGRRRAPPCWRNPGRIRCHAFRWGEQVWGLQFHPEFSTTHMRGYIRARNEALVSEGRCGKRLAREVSAAPHARRVLRRFVRHARQHPGVESRPG